MKLNQEQLDHIDGFLNRMELTHIDLRNEVLDHMAASVEANLEKGHSFEEAADLVFEDWRPELRSHQSFWLGLLWQGPEILIDKAVVKMKTIYLKAGLITICINGLFYFLKDFLSIAVFKTMNVVIGLVYILLFLVLLYLNNKIKKTNFETTFSFLFKINAIGFSFLLLLYNPLFTNIFGLIKNNIISLAAIAMHVFTLAFCYFFLEFYNSHMNNERFRLS